MLIYGGAKDDMRLKSTARTMVVVCAVFCLLAARAAGTSAAAGHGSAQDYAQSSTHASTQGPTVEAFTALTQRILEELCLASRKCIVIMNEAGPVVAVRRLHSRYKPALVQSYMRKEPAL